MVNWWNLFGLDTSIDLIAFRLKYSTRLNIIISDCNHHCALKWLDVSRISVFFRGSIVASKEHGNWRWNSQKYSIQITMMHWNESIYSVHWTTWRTTHFLASSIHFGTLARLSALKNVKSAHWTEHVLAFSRLNHWNLKARIATCWHHTQPRAHAFQNRMTAQHWLKTLIQTQYILERIMYICTHLQFSRVAHGTLKNTGTWTDTESNSRAEMKAEMNSTLQQHALHRPETPAKAFLPCSVPELQSYRLENNNCYPE